jgi:hypothetical protein
LLYRREPALPLEKDVKPFNKPLGWWRLKVQHQFPLLATLPIKLLPILTTSAPSKRSFSVAGLTITEE